MKTTSNDGGHRTLTSRSAARRRLSVLTAAVLLVSQVAVGSAAGAPEIDDEVPEPAIAQLVGQKLVVRMAGTTPSPALLRRIRRGEIGGVVLFGFNITTADALVALTTRLQGAAVAGGRPRLLIMVDQEGGTVLRVPWAPPTKSARAIGLDGRSSVARRQGERSARALLALGINVNLAPVADVPSSTRSFMYRERRTFSAKEARTARLATAFANGTRSEGVVPTMKHFPGIGRAKLHTDRNAVTIRAARSSLEKDLLPFRSAIDAGVPMIMLSNATYSAIDPANGAGWSRAVTSLLRDELGFTGVTITDSLSGTAIAYGVSGRKLAIRAARAGTDLIMLTSSEGASQKAFETLVAKAESGALDAATLRASYDRILALKGGWSAAGR